MTSSLTPWIIINHCPLPLIPGQSLWLSECFLSTYYLHKPGMQKWPRLLPKSSWPHAGLWAWKTQPDITLYQVVCTCALHWGGTDFLSPETNSGCFRHRRKQHFVLAPAFNRLIIFGISTPARFINLSHLVLIMAGLQQGSGSSFPARVGQKAVGLSWMGHAWTSLSRRMLRVHLCTWASLLIRKWCHCVPLGESGRGTTVWSLRKGRPLNFMILENLDSWFFCWELGVFFAGNLFVLYWKR